MLAVGVFYVGVRGFEWTIHSHSVSQNFFGKKIVTVWKGKILTVLKGKFDSLEKEKFLNVGWDFK
jgi:hypothetical protein